MTEQERNELIAKLLNFVIDYDVWHSIASNDKTWKGKDKEKLITLARMYRSRALITNREMEAARFDVRDLANKLWTS